MDMFIQQLKPSDYPIRDEEHLNELFMDFKMTINSDLEQAKARTLGFGKYKGQTLEKIAKTDKLYLKYLYDENTFIKEKAVRLRQQMKLVMDMA